MQSEFYISQYFNFSSIYKIYFILTVFLVIAVVLVLSFSPRSYALSAYTSNVIHGSAPYLTFDKGRTRITDTNNLLAITLSDGRRITPETNDSLITPIELPRVGDSFADIGMLVPTNINKIAMNTLIGAHYNYWGDGDGQGSNNISATGDLTLTIVDKNNKSVPRNEIPTICNSPYKLSLSSSAGYLTTRYGIPNRSSFSTGSVDYYINPNKASPSVCFAKPNLKYG